MSSFVIEKNIPIPDESRRGAGKGYPWGELKDGDSVVVPGRNAVSAASHYGKRNGIEFRSAKLDDGTYRVWRVGVIDNAPDVHS